MPLSGNFPLNITFRDHPKSSNTKLKVSSQQWCLGRLVKGSLKVLKSLLASPGSAHVKHCTDSFLSQLMGTPSLQNAKGMNLPCTISSEAVKCAFAMQSSPANIRRDMHNWHENIATTSMHDKGVWKTSPSNHPTDTGPDMSKTAGDHIVWPADLQHV